MSNEHRRELPCAVCGLQRNGAVGMYGAHRNRKDCVAALQSALAAAEGRATVVLGQLASVWTVAQDAGLAPRDRLDRIAALSSAAALNGLLRNSRAGAGAVAEQSAPVDPSKVAATITEAWRATASDVPVETAGAECCEHGCTRTRGAPITVRVERGPGGWPRYVCNGCDKPLCKGTGRGEGDGP